LYIWNAVFLYAFESEFTFAQKINFDNHLMIKNTILSVIKRLNVWNNCSESKFIRNLLLAIGYFYTWIVTKITCKISSEHSKTYLMNELSVYWSSPTRVKRIVLNIIPRPFSKEECFVDLLHLLGKTSKTATSHSLLDLDWLFYESGKSSFPPYLYMAWIKALCMFSPSRYNKL